MIRPYEETDLQACAQVYCSAFSAPPWHENWTEAVAQKRVSELMCTPMSRGFVCEENSRITAFAAGRMMTYLHGTEYVLDEFCVAYDVQGQGIGRKLMQQIRTVMRENGCRSIVLNTTKGYPSERFYERNGFVHSPDMITMYQMLQTESASEP